MLEFDVQQMTCNHCVRAVTEAVHSTDPQAKIEVDLATHKVRVETPRERATVAAALAEAGYAPAA